MAKETIIEVVELETLEEIKATEEIKAIDQIKAMDEIKATEEIEVPPEYEDETETFIPSTAHSGKEYYRVLHTFWPGMK